MSSFQKPTVRSHPRFLCIIKDSFSQHLSRNCSFYSEWFQDWTRIESSRLRRFSVKYSSDLPRNLSNKISQFSLKHPVYFTYKGQVMNQKRARKYPLVPVLHGQQTLGFAISPRSEVQFWSKITAANVLKATRENVLKLTQAASVAQSSQRYSLNTEVVGSRCY